VKGFNFSTNVRVRFAETDAQGVAHNSNTFIWFEVARVDYLARHAGGYQRLRDEGVEAVVLEAWAKFVLPTRFDEELTIHARCVEMKGARFRFEYVIERAGEVVTEGWTLHAAVDGTTMRPTRIPAWLIAAVATAESSS
jgi:acyl-CoA thioester hydrolase